MKLQRFVLAAAAAALLAVAGPGFAQTGDTPPPPPPPPGSTDVAPPQHPALLPFWQSPRIAEHLGLTDDQIAALEASFQAAITALEAQQGAIPEARKALREALAVDEPDLDAVLAALEALKAAEAEREAIILGHVVVVKNVLTAEQEEKLAALRRQQPPDLQEAIRRAMEELTPLVRRLLQDCEWTPEDGQILSEQMANLPPAVRDGVAPLLRQLVRRILEECGGGPTDPPDDNLNEQVRRVLQHLAPIIQDMVADCRITERERLFLQNFFANLPPAVAEVVKPLVDAKIREALANCDPSDPSLDEQVRAAMQEIMPLIQRALADCDLTNTEMAAIQAKVDALPTEVAAKVQPLVDAAIARIQANCDPVNPDEVTQALERLTALVKNLASDGLTWEEVRQIRQALAALPDPVERIVAPQILELVRQILESQGGDGPGDGIDDATRAAYEAMIAMVKRLAGDDDGLTQDDIAAIRAALAEYDPAIVAVIGPRIHELIRRILAGQTGDNDGPADSGRSAGGPGDGGAGSPPPARPAARTPLSPKGLTR